MLLIIKRANNYYTSVEDENSVVDPKPAFEQLGDVNSHVSVFKRLGPQKVKPTNKSAFKRLGVAKYSSTNQKVKRPSCLEEVDANECRSKIPSRMKRKTTLVVNCDKVLKAKMHTIVQTRCKEEDEESVGSSYHVTTSQSVVSLRQGVDMEDDEIMANI